MTDTATTQATAQATDVKTIVLKKSGREAQVQPFKGKHVREAQRRAGGNSEDIIYHIICALVTIEGQPLFIEDLDAMDGADVLQLMSEFGEGNL